MKIRFPWEDPKNDNCSITLLIRYGVRLMMVVNLTSWMIVGGMKLAEWYVDNS